MPRQRSSLPPQVLRTASSRFLSCERCRVRKARCSRQDECTNCKRARVPCVWLQSSPTRSAQEADLVGALAENVRLRALVKNLFARLALGGHRVYIEPKVYSDGDSDHESVENDTSYPNFRQFYASSASDPSSPVPSQSTAAVSSEPVLPSAIFSSSEGCDLGDLDIPHSSPPRVESGDQCYDLHSLLDQSSFSPELTQANQSSFLPELTQANLTSLNSTFFESHMTFTLPSFNGEWWDLRSLESVKSAAEGSQREM